jgi:hypothetical protein
MQDLQEVRTVVENMVIWFLRWVATSKIATWPISVDLDFFTTESHRTPNILNYAMSGSQDCKASLYSFDLL